MIPNQWYPILEARKLGRKPLHVRRLGIDLVIWRRPDGRIVAQHDRCPHKGVRLSAGRLVGDQIQCPYHGFRFDAEGTCVAAPCIGATGKIPSTMRVEVFDAREAHRLIWLWYGDDQIERPELPIVPELMNLKSYADDISYDRPVHYTRYIESLLEFYHVPWVHRERWYNVTDYIAVGGLRFGAQQRYYETAQVVNTTCVVQGQRIDYTFDLVNENDPGAPAFPWKIVFIAPCLVYVENKEFNAAQWSTPIDDENTHVMFRWCGFKMERVPAAVQKLLTRMALASQQYGQDYQDYMMMKTQTPRVSEVGANVFTAADELNAQFLHLRRRLRREAASSNVLRFEAAQGRTRS